MAKIKEGVLFSDDAFKEIEDLHADTPHADTRSAVTRDAPTPTR